MTVANNPTSTISSSYSTREENWDPEMMFHWLSPMLFPGDGSSIVTRVIQPLVFLVLLSYVYSFVYGFFKPFIGLVIFITKVVTRTIQILFRAISKFLKCIGNAFCFILGFRFQNTHDESKNDTRDMGNETTIKNPVGVDNDNPSYLSSKQQQQQRTKVTSSPSLNTSSKIDSARSHGFPHDQPTMNKLQSPYLLQPQQQLLHRDEYYLEQKQNSSDSSNDYNSEEDINADWDEDAYNMQFDDNCATKKEPHYLVQQQQQQQQFFDSHDDYDSEDDINSEWNEKEYNKQLVAKNHATKKVTKAKVKKTGTVVSSSKKRSRSSVEDVDTIDNKSKNEAKSSLSRPSKKKQRLSEAKKAKSNARKWARKNLSKCKDI